MSQIIEKLINHNEYEKKVFIIENKNYSELYLIGEELDEILSKNFKEFQFDLTEIQVKDSWIKSLVIKGTITSLKMLEQAIEDVGCNIWEALLFINHQFQITRQNYLKFRGDLAEAIFLYKKGGKKLMEGLSTDISHNDNMIEVKSFSSQKMTISISMQQILEKTTKFAVELKIANNGMSISEIAQNISGNDEFKKYLLENYKKTYFDITKYEITEPFDITNQLPIISLPSCVLKANLVVKIEKKFTII